MSLLTVLLLLQVALPLALLVWLLWLPLQGRLAWSLQILASGLVLLWLAAAGVWTVPPWWTLWLYAALWLGGLLRGLVRWRRRDLPRFPRRARTLAVSILLLALSGYAAHEAARSWAGRQPPSQPLQAMEFPLGTGTYLVVNGGNDIRINAHLKTREPGMPRLRRWQGNGYAVDLVAIDRDGLRASDLQPSDNRAYRIFGRPVLAPCDGTVLTAVDGLPDMTPPQYDAPERLAGNHVILSCGDVQVVLAHFRQGSVRLRAGDAVRTGQVLAEVGNSGGTDEPHLHVHVQRPGTVDAPMGGEPLPASYFGRFLVRGDRIVVERRAGVTSSDPRSGRPATTGPVDGVTHCLRSTSSIARCAIPTRSMVDRRTSF